MNMMTYQGHAARIEYGDEDGCFVGHIGTIQRPQAPHFQPSNQRHPTPDAITQPCRRCLPADVGDSPTLWYS